MLTIVYIDIYRYIYTFISMIVYMLLVWYTSRGTAPV